MNAVPREAGAVPLAPGTVTLPGAGAAASARAPHRPAPIAESARAPLAFGRRTALAALGLALLLGVWELVVRVGLVPALLMPPPSAIPPAFLREVAAGEWLFSVLASFRHYLTGLAIGSGLGVALGLAAGSSGTVDALIGWVVRLLRPIPGLAWIPFAILWFGVSPTGATFIVAIGVVWINFFATHGAVRAVDRDLVEVADAFGRRGFLDRLWTITLPAASPAILAGFRTGVGQAWMAVVAAEIFGVPGLGQRMMQASSLLATDVVVVYMATMAALYGLFDTGTILVRDRLLRWQR